MTLRGTLLTVILTVWATPAAAQAPAPSAAPSAAPQGNAENGKALFTKRGCWTCHGYDAQGGDLNPNATGPRLAGRAASWPAFLKYVRHPTGNMVPYTEKILPDRELADMFAWLRSIPPPPPVSSIPLLALSSLSAQGAEVTVIGPGGVRAAVTALIPEFERRTGHTVKATFGSGGGTRQQVLKGEPFDVPIVQPPLADVIASGHVVASSETPLATVPVVLAVKKGARKPDISTPDAIRKVFLAAKSVSFPNPARGAAAGVSIMAMLEKLGIADAVKAKVTYGQLNLVATGQAEIGLTFQSEINEPGIDVVGTLPRDLVPPTGLVGFVSSHAKNPAVAKAFLEFLASPDAAATYRKLGMQPGR